MPALAQTVSPNDVNGGEKPPQEQFLQQPGISPEQPSLENAVEEAANNTKSHTAKPEVDDFDKIFGRTPKNKQEYNRQNNTLTLYDIVKFYRNRGVVGEESLVSAMTLAAVNSISFGVEGFSGSGKTFIVDKLMELLPEKWVYKIELSSKMAVFYDSERINGCRIIYIPELQKAMQDKKSPIIEVIKNLTEGKDATRIVTKKDRNGATEYSIKKGISIIYTLALENYFKKDEESSRRLMRFQTDSSKEHLDEIHDYKARRRFSIGPEAASIDKLSSMLTEHISKIADMGHVKVLDPCAAYIKELIPKTQKSVGYVDHYYALVDACAKFHYSEREIFEIGGVGYILANVEDHFNVFKMYFKEFTRTLKDFVDRMDGGEEKDNALAELVEVKDPDWNECLSRSKQILISDDSLERTRETFPNLIGDWYSRQYNNGIISTLDYKTGKQLNIVDLNDKI